MRVAQPSRMTPLPSTRFTVRLLGLLYVAGTLAACGVARSHDEAEPPVPAPSTPQELFSLLKAADGDVPAFLAFDREDVYFVTDRGAVHRVAKDGSGSSLIAETGRRATGLAVGSDVVVAVEDADGAAPAVLRVTKSGEVAEIDEGRAIDFATDGLAVYWTVERSDGRAAVVAYRGGEREVLNEELAANAIDAAGDHVYFAAAGASSSSLYRMRASGGAPTEIGVFRAPLYDHGSLRVVEGNVYFLDGEGWWRAVATRGGEVTSLEQVSLRSEVFDEAGVFGYGYDGEGEALLRMPRQGGARSRVARLEGQGRALVVDANSVVWIDDVAVCLAYEGFGKGQTCVAYEHDLRIYRVRK